MNDIENSLSIYQGEFMQDFQLKSKIFNYWIEEKRFELQELVRNNMSILLDFYMEEKDMLKSILLARRILALDPLNENIHQVLIHLYARQGRRLEAIKQYQNCKKILSDELNLKPNFKTQKLHEDITSQSFFLMQKEKLPQFKMTQHCTL